MKVLGEVSQEAELSHGFSPSLCCVENCLRGESEKEGLSKVETTLW